MEICADCNHRNTGGALTCERCGATLSVAEDRLDQMVQRASSPRLATLYRRGKEAGLITAGFGGSNPGA